MDNNRKNLIHDTGMTAFILIVYFLISLAIQNILNTQSISPIFVLASFLVALFTNGYWFGIVAALVSVLAVNYAFKFPYFAFNFTIFENLMSAVILIFVTIATSTLTTEIKRQEEIKFQAEKEKTRANLLRAVSHDLRTPLTTIYGSAATIIENYDALSDEKKLDILNGIQKDSKWLVRMVENLLSITRVDSSNVKLIKNPVVVEELVDSAFAKFKKNYPDCAVELSIPDDFVVISADAMLIEQVLLNLLENAVQHAKGMTKLMLKISVVDSKAVFEVIDNGCGIEKYKLKDIFTGYYKTDDEPSENQKRCMGIGLSVCAAIIRAHGGEISARNARKGGMIFRFSLDLEEAANE